MGYIGTIILWIIGKVTDAATGEAISGWLEQKFPKVFKNETKEIVAIYERRIEEKNLEIQRLHEERATTTRQHATQQERIDRSLKRRSISVEKLVEKYHKPLNAILISYATQKEKVGEKFKNSHFIKDELQRFSSKYLGGTDTIIPPRSVPSTIKNQDDLKKWFDEEILKGRYCKLKFLVIFDIRNHAYWGTFLPYIQKAPMHSSIGEVLKVEDVFTDDQIRTIAIGDVIASGDIAWLASAVVSQEDLESILRNQKIIEERLHNPSLRVLADDNMRGAVESALAGIIEHPAGVAHAIVEEAKFWNERVKN